MDAIKTAVLPAFFALAESVCCSVEILFKGGFNFSIKQFYDQYKKDGYNQQNTNNQRNRQ
jgi:hypothetical protein